MKPQRNPIVGPDVADQQELRRAKPVRSVDEIVEFLARLEEIFGPVDRVQTPTTGEHFKL